MTTIIYAITGAIVDADRITVSKAIHQATGALQDAGDRVRKNETQFLLAGADPGSKVEKAAALHIPVYHVTTLADCIKVATEAVNGIRSVADRYRRVTERTAARLYAAGTNVWFCRAGSTPTVETLTLAAQSYPSVRAATPADGYNVDYYIMPAPAGDPRTRTARLAERIGLIYANHWDECRALPTEGPRGGHNAATLPGWAHSPNATITKACNTAGVPVMPWWSGRNPTPATGIPACVLADVVAAYKEVFQRE